MKRLSMLLSMVFVLGFLVPEPLFAQEPEHEQYAQALHEMGLLQGTDKGFELERGATRVEAISMLIRLLGKEQDALTATNATSQHPFKDVPTWANLYVAYAYHNQLSAGIGNNKFGSTDPVTATQYFTFILRALGYDDTKGDFSWEQAVRKAEQLGMKEASAYTDPNQKLLRGHLTHISYHSLDMSLKDQETTLYQKLVDENVVAQPDSEAQIDESRIVIPIQYYDKDKNEYIIPFETIKKHLAQANSFMSIVHEDKKMLSEEQNEAIGLAYNLYIPNRIPANDFNEVPLIFGGKIDGFFQMIVIFDNQGNILAYAKPDEEQLKKLELSLELKLPELLVSLHSRAVELSKDAYEFSSSLFYLSTYQYDNYGFYYDEFGTKFTFDGLPYDGEEFANESEQPVEYVTVPTYRLDMSQLPASARNFTKISWFTTPANEEVGDLRDAAIWNRLWSLMLELEINDIDSFYSKYKEMTGFSMLANSKPSGPGVSRMFLIDAQDRVVAYTYHTYDQLRQWASK